MKQLAALILPLALILISLACANQTSPMGGPKDTIPPVLVRSSPDSNQINFRGRTIELTFNEMLQLFNPKEEIIIIPPTGKKTAFELKDNRVSIEPEIPFRDSTTYTLYFREGIKDITEGNIPVGLHLVFSTGPYIDSMKIEGTIRHALKEAIPEDITIGVYQSDTFDIMKHSPEFFTKSTKEGTFRITNLKPGSYRIYAFQDKNKNLKIESQSELFGFLAQPLDLTANKSKLSIALVNIDSRPLRLTSIRNQSTANTIRFNKPLRTYSLHSTVPVISSFGDNHAEVIAHYPSINPDQPVDSIQVSFAAVDSVEQRVDTTFFLHRDGREKIKGAFSTSLLDPVLNHETKQLQFTITFNKPISTLNPDSLNILSDTATFIPLPVAAIRIDTMRNQLTFSHNLLVKDSLIAPELRVGKGFIVSLDGDSSRAAKKNIDVITPQSTATLLVEVQTKHKNFIVEILGSQEKVVARAVNNPKPTFRFLNPQTLRIRVIIDANGNGVWDTANYLQNREPERAVYYLNSDKKSEIPVRANWEVGPNVVKL